MDAFDTAVTLTMKLGIHFHNLKEKQYKNQHLRHDHLTRNTNNEPETMQEQPDMINNNSITINLKTA